MDFKSFASNTLGVDLSAPLIGVNVDVLQTLLLALMRKITEFNAKLERVEYELDTKTTKSELFALRERIKGLPTHEDLDNLMKGIETKAEKADVELLLDSTQSLAEKTNKLESQFKSKANKQDFEIIHSQISYLQESLGNQEQEVQNIRKLRQQINQLASIAKPPPLPSTNPPSQPGAPGQPVTASAPNAVAEATAGALIEEETKSWDQRMTDMNLQIEYLQDRLEDMERVVKNPDSVPMVVTNNKSEEVRSGEEESDDEENNQETRKKTKKRPNSRHAVLSQNSSPSATPQPITPSLSRPASKAAIRGRDSAKKAPVEALVKQQVQDLLADHPSLSKIEHTIENTHDLFEAQKKEISKLTTLVESIIANQEKQDMENNEKMMKTLETALAQEPTEGGTDPQIRTDTSKVQVGFSREDLEVLHNSLQEISVSLESKAGKKHLITLEGRCTDLENEIQAVRDLVQSKQFKEKIVEAILIEQKLPKAQSSHLRERDEKPPLPALESQEDAQIRIELDRMMRKLQTLKEQVQQVQRDVNEEKSACRALQQTQQQHHLILARLDSMGTSGTAKISQSKEPSSNKQQEVKEREREKEPAKESVPSNSNQKEPLQNNSKEDSPMKEDPSKIASRSQSIAMKEMSAQLILMKNQFDQVFESLDANSKDLKNLHGAMKEIHTALEEKADERHIHELQDSQDVVREDMVQLRALLDQKADQLDKGAVPVPKLEIKKHNVEFQDIKDEVVLRGILDDITNNINLLFESKADAQAVQKVLSEKGDLKVLATKANRSYCEALVERVAKSLTGLSNKVDNILLNNTNDLSGKISQIRKLLANKVDRSEIGNIMTQAPLINGTDLAPLSHIDGIGLGLEASVSRRPIAGFCLSCNRPVQRSTEKIPPVPLLPSAPQSNNTRGGYDVEFYRKMRKRSTSPPHAHKLTQQFRKQFLAQVKEDSEEEDSSPAKLPAIPPSPPHASKKEIHPKDPFRISIGQNPLQSNLSSSTEGLESLMSDPFSITNSYSNHGPSSEVSKSGHPPPVLKQYHNKEDKSKAKNVFFELEGSRYNKSPSNTN